MKSNTIFHCGTNEIKYSCFRGKDKKYYLRQTVAGATHYRMRRIRRCILDEYFQTQGLEAKLNWCAMKMAEEVRMYSLPFTPRTPHCLAHTANHHHMHAFPDGAHDDQPEETL